MKQKAISCALFIAIASMLGSIGCIMSGCTHNKIQVIDNKNVVTNAVSTSAFNDEHYVWESFYFSTNRVNSTAK